MILRLLVLLAPVVWSQYNYNQQQAGYGGQQQPGFGQAQQNYGQQQQQQQQQQRGYGQTQINQQNQRNFGQAQSGLLQGQNTGYNPNQPQQQQQRNYALPQTALSQRNPGSASSNQVASRSVVQQVLTPYNMSSSSSTNSNGVTIQFQLRGYSNPSMALPNGYTCVCPSSFTCSYLNTAPSCYFSFTFIVSAPDTSVRYLATDFITLDSSGSLPNAQSGQWAQSYVIQLPTKPSAIDVFAHNLGPVINQADGMLVSVDTLTHADTFVVPLSDEIPAVGGVQSMTQQHSFTGKLLGTNLLLSYSIACTGSLIGPNCDLSCTTSSINSATAACRSNDTGFYYVCTYSSGGQVSSCNSCPWGIKENTYCQDEGGGVLDPYTAGVVSSGFRTATIILSVLLLVFLLLIILLFVALCIIRSRRRPVEKEMVSYEHNGTPSSRPLLTAAYRAEQPTPQPRSSQPPSLDARPAKSSMRKAMSPPDQFMDSRDTSFNSDLGMRQSRSAVV